MSARRGVALLVGGYLALAGMTRLLEARGYRRCGCSDACWCQRPGLSTFRWVFPYGHG